MWGSEGRVVGGVSKCVGVWGDVWGSIEEGVEKCAGVWGR